MDENEQYIFAQSLWRDMGGMTGREEGCITKNEFLAAYGTNNLKFDTTLFRWANGELKKNDPLPADNCLD